jgi:hypothetical protein
MSMGAVENSRSVLRYVMSCLSRLVCYEVHPWAVTPVVGWVNRSFQHFKHQPCSFIPVHAQFISGGRVSST